MRLPHGSDIISGMEKANKSLFKGMIEDRAFMRRMWAISLPIMLQQLLGTAMYMVDTMMIGALGDVPLAGVGAATQLAFLLDLVLFGVMSGGSIYMSQYFGKQDRAGFRSTLGFTLMLCIGFAALFTVIGRLFGGFVVGIYSENETVIAAGVEYLDTACLAYVAIGVSYAYGIAHKSARRPLLPLISGAVALVINIFFNWVLIYGNLGFPRLGLTGAAIGTLIGACANMLTLITASYIKPGYASARLDELLAQTAAGVKQFVQVSLPAFLNDMLWAVCALIINWVYGRMGTDTFAAIMIYNAVDKLTMVAYMGMGTASAVVLGNTLGEGDSERALLYGKRYTLLALLMGLLSGVLCCTVLPYAVNLYTETSETVKHLAFWSIIVLGIYQPLYALNYTLICGVLRSGGDTRAAAVIDLIPQWLLALPITAIAGLALDMPLYIVLLCVIPSCVLRSVLALRRMKSGIWARTLV